LKEQTRERVPLEWATTQNNLGNALDSLGERDAGTARLEAAVAVYQEALKEWKRERVPLDWALAQSNLGNALFHLGKREASTAGLEAAVKAYQEALEEQTREGVPLDWAATQASLGNALLSLGEREAGTARLEAAVGAFQEALKEQTRERVPLNWAMLLRPGLTGAAFRSAANCELVTVQPLFFLCASGFSSTERDQKNKSSLDRYRLMRKPKAFLELLSKRSLVRF
jgi:tetratricopeptide (TPR) repeat protein